MTAADAATRPGPHAAAAPAPGQGEWALSPSRASDFMTCPLLYRFRVIDRLPEPPSPVATRGTLVHAVLDRLFDRPAAQRDLGAALELLGPEWERLLEERPDVAGLFPDAVHIAGEVAQEPAAQSLEAWLAGARELLETYFHLEDPRRLEPAEREVLVEAELEGGIRLRGYVDRVDIAAQGQLRIVDYKTGSAPPELFEDKALFQLKFYALVIWRVRGVIPTLLQLIYLGDGQVLRYAPDEVDLLATERKVRALWNAIERALRVRDFPPRPGRICDWCSHQARCPAFGGEAPPYPESADTGSSPLPVDEPVLADESSP